MKSNPIARFDQRVKMLEAAPSVQEIHETLDYNGLKIKVVTKRFPSHKELTAFLPSIKFKTVWCPVVFFHYPANFSVLEYAVMATVYKSAA